MSRRFSSDGSLFIGRLSKNCRVRDLEDVFEPYGRMSRCEIKYGAEMAYGFIDYEDRRDADDAIRYEDGREVAGSAIIVEWAKGAPRQGGGGGGGGPRGDRGGRDMRDSRGDSGRNRGADECYRCHRSGHWARDCPDDRHYGFRRPSGGRRSRSPPPRRRRSRSRSPRERRRSHRSRSRSRGRKSPSCSPSRLREEPNLNGGGGGARTPSRSRSRSAKRDHSPS